MVVTVRLTAFRTPKGWRSDRVRAEWECKMLGKVLSLGSMGSMLLIPSIRSTALSRLKHIVNKAPLHAPSHMQFRDAGNHRRDQGLGKLVKVARGALLHFSGTQNRELGLDGASTRRLLSGLCLQSKARNMTRCRCRWRRL